MLTHVLVHGEHDQFNDAHEHELHIGRLTEKSAHGYQRCGNCNIRAEQTENDHIVMKIFDIIIYLFSRGNQSPFIVSSLTGSNNPVELGKSNRIV